MNNQVLNLCCMREINEVIDELIRDLTKVGSIPKSEVRRRIEEILAVQEQEVRKQTLKEELAKLPRTFWEDEDHAVGGYISKKTLYELLTLDNLQHEAGDK